MPANINAILSKTLRDAIPSTPTLPVSIEIVDGGINTDLDDAEGDN